VDGVVDEIAGGRERLVNTASGIELRIAYDLNNTGRIYQGLIDDVRIYDRALSADEIQAIIQNPGGTVTQALRPDPADGALHEDTWVILSWLPGDFALSHDVYIGDNTGESMRLMTPSRIVRGKAKSGILWFPPRPRIIPSHQMELNL